MDEKMHALRHRRLWGIGYGATALWDFDRVEFELGSCFDDDLHEWRFFFVHFFIF